MFPFIDVNRDAVQPLSRTIERALHIKESMASSLNCELKGYTLDAVSTALNFLHQEMFRFEDKDFIDCLGNGAEACMYAQVSGFKSLLSVEINHASYRKGLRVMNEFTGDAQDIKALNEKMTLRVGSFLDDFNAADFDCLYLDATILRSSMLDEGFLINRFLQFCQHTLHGSYLILVTITKTINLNDYLEFAEEIFVKIIDVPIGDEITGKAALYIYQKR